MGNLIGAGVQTLMSSSAFGNASFSSEGVRCQGAGVLKWQHRE